MSDKPVTGSTNSEAPRITAESLKRKVEEINCTSSYKLLHSGLLEGIKVLPDLSGMMCGDNEYVVVVGRKLWDQMQGLAVIADKATRPQK